MGRGKQRKKGRAGNDSYHFVKSEQDSSGFFRKARCRQGFTLLELLISISLLSIIFVIIYGSLRLGIDSWEKGEERIAVYQRVRTFLRRLSQDISSTVLYYYKKDRISGKRYLAFSGIQNKFSLVTGARGLIFNRPYGAGLREVSYFLGENSDGKQSLMRSERFVHPDFPFKEKDRLVVDLIPDVASLSVRYLKVKKNTEGLLLPGGWSDSFAPVPEFNENQFETKIMQVFPAAIEVTLTLLEKKGDELIEKNLPPLVIPIEAGREITKEKTFE